MGNFYKIMSITFWRVKPLVVLTDVVRLMVPDVLCVLRRRRFECRSTPFYFCRCKHNECLTLLRTIGTDSIIRTTVKLLSLNKKLLT